MCYNLEIVHVDLGFYRNISAKSMPAFKGWKSFSSYNPVISSFFRQNFYLLSTLPQSNHSKFGKMSPAFLKETPVYDMIYGMFYGSVWRGLRYEAIFEQVLVTGENYELKIVVNRGIGSFRLMVLCKLQ